MHATVAWEAAEAVYGDDDSRTQAAKRAAVAHGATMAKELATGERILAETQASMLAAKVAELRLRQLN